MEERQDLISRQVAIDALRDAENHAFNSFYKGLAKAHKIIADLPSVQPDHNADSDKKVSISYGHESDLISRQQVIDTITSETYYPCYFAEMIRKLPAAQPELTDEQSIAHLQSSGWMQRHDKEMYESGLKEQLADDSDSYDSLLPAVHPEVIRCKNCEHWKNEHLCERLSRFGSLETKADFYCGYAERKN